MEALVHWREPLGMPRETLPRRIARLVEETPPWESLAGRHAAVCMLFVPPEEGGAEARLVLTRRTTSVRTHKGQIGFAGGHADPEDVTPAETALRELSEELGIPKEKATVHGMLPPEPAITGIPVYTLVVTSSMLPGEMTPSAEEVAEIITAPWSAFRPESNQPFRFNMFGVWRDSDLFRIGSHNVWGLTARIIRAAELG